MSYMRVITDFGSPFYLSVTNRKSEWVPKSISVL